MDMREKIKIFFFIREIEFYLIIFKLFADVCNEICDHLILF